MSTRTLFCCAGLALGVSVTFADTFTVQPLGGPMDPIQLGDAGNQGVRPQQFFWTFPDVHTASPAAATLVRVSPDGQWGLGSNAVQGLAARFNRNGGAEAFLVSANGTTPNTAMASSSGNNVVVGIGTSDGGSRRGFVWTPANGTQDLGILVTDLTSAAVDVSGGGDVIVGYGDPAPPGIGRHPLRWTGTGASLSRLAQNGGGFVNGGEATAVSSDGQVVVGFRNVGGVQRGFRWTETGRDIDLGSPSNPNDLTLITRANDVSGNGQWTVGEAETTDGPLQATMWNAAGEPVALADLLTAAGNTDHQFFSLRTIASVSFDGRTVSGTCFDAVAGQFRAFVASLTFSTGGCRPDLGQTGGVPGNDGTLDNNDFVVFVDGFFQQDAVTDFGSVGGVAGADGFFDNNDFVVFVDSFFTGCD
ncbi:MAG TPA: GC-type dockerin domain-anchored protein [Phycisphaerales bacterium]|nr:GC-type dockerin domain-anchored protein [Phycisphaerales bacterium]